MIWPEVNQKICEAWGLNPKDVEAITIRFYPHKKPDAVVHCLINEGVMRVLLDLRANNDRHP